MMGIGIDIETIERFEGEAMSRNGSFVSKIYTEAEIEYSFSKKNPSQHLAARYAGKEAVIKACSSIGIQIINYKEIEILNNEQGVPLVKTHNEKINALDIKVSLSHCTDKAIAFALISN